MRLVLRGFSYGGAPVVGIWCRGSGKCSPQEAKVILFVSGLKFLMYIVISELSNHVMLSKNKFCID